MEKNEKRITIKTSFSFHKEIKQRALNRNISVTRYVMRALWDQIKKEKSYEQPEKNHEEKAEK